jgi:hypothetical protein
MSLFTADAEEGVVAEVAWEGLSEASVDGCSLPAGAASSSSDSSVRGTVAVSMLCPILTKIAGEGEWANPKRYRFVQQVPVRRCCAADRGCVNSSVKGARRSFEGRPPSGASTKPSHKVTAAALLFLALGLVAALITHMHKKYTE